MTQNARILQALKFGRKLTPMAALHLFGCFRLSARIYELRRQGHRIESGKVHVKDKVFSCYWMAT